MAPAVRGHGLRLSPCRMPGPQRPRRALPGPGPLFWAHPSAGAPLAPRPQGLAPPLTAADPAPSLRWAGAHPPRGGATRSRRICCPGQPGRTSGPEPGGWPEAARAGVPLCVPRAWAHLCAMSSGRLCLGRRRGPDWTRMRLVRDRDPGGVSDLEERERSAGWGTRSYWRGLRTGPEHQLQRHEAPGSELPREGTQWVCPRGPRVSPGR